MTTLPAPAPSATGAKPPATARRIGARVLIGVPLAAYALVSLYPFLWMVSGAFKDQFEVVRGGHLIPEHPTLHTLTDTWNRLHFFDYFLNSLKVTALTVVLTLLIYAAAGYAFAVLRFPGRDWLYRLFVALLFVPGVTVLLPIILLEHNLGVLGTHYGLVLPFVNGTAPLSVMLLTGAFRAVPKELRDAARVDGAGEAHIFARVHLPLARPALITVALLTAIPTWNEYLLTKVSLNDESAYTLSLGLQQLSAQNVPHYNNLMAGALIVVIPVILLFLALQRYFVNGLVGAVKG
ncbi:carbohydrate ABC transporter permease [Streptomyces solisilvae]|uniref:carbohydrate ABC transporter permease n=1 Tax=Streptomyces TaxID=1883 RepID=UPI00081E8467|nr:MULTISPECIES: carbohydrate ABC transporter permease [unclassified Streptomyces]AUA15469.1 L-arabinose transport system permease protein AraQ [Streptomyces sp. M56]MYU18261.1 ABC transporter permease subunit [Streptomyces sp. SID8361]MYX61978.1 ABC transporter permease subunit [Streptomyces sp. SID8382]SCG12784.1 multiple sugar transport system permease protein [Streptomyces sp. MnatMP-M27]